jgi:hypothetical protein
MGGEAGERLIRSLDGAVVLDDAVPEPGVREYHAEGDRRPSGVFCEPHGGEEPRGRVVVGNLLRLHDLDVDALVRVIDAVRSVLGVAPLAARASISWTVFVNPLGPHRENKVPRRIVAPADPDLA